MANSYRPAYYSSIQHSLTSICKSLFKSNHRRLLTDEQKHSEALKWQQDQFHKILHLTALHREGIVDESEVSAFRATLLESIAATPNPANQESPRLTRDKLLFLQVSYFNPIYILLYNLFIYLVFTLICFQLGTATLEMHL